MYGREDKDTKTEDGSLAEFSKPVLPATMQYKNLTALPSHCIPL